MNLNETSIGKNEPHERDKPIFLDTRERCLFIF